ncbi:MAG: hypothetical protein IJR82_05470 [Bacilli bacterium]|nr:hypothetical protein [Bacilli bacterium]
MEKYKKEAVVDVSTLSVEQYSEAAKYWSEGYNTFEEILNFCLNNRVSTLACCKGHNIGDCPYMTFVYNKDSRKLINGFLNGLQRIKGIQIMFSTTGDTNNPFNVTVYANMFNRDKVFNLINNSLKNRQESDELYSQLNAALRLSINLDYTDLGLAHITLYNKLFNSIFSARLMGMFVQSDLISEHKSYGVSPMYMYRSAEQLDMISDSIEKMHELFYRGNFSMSAFATTQEKVDGIMNFNTEQERETGSISRSRL